MYDDARGADAREVRDGERDGARTRIVSGTRRYPTTQDDLWDALTTVDRIRRFMGPLEGDLSLGGRYQLEGNAGGTITECDAPHTFAITWEFMGSVSWVRVQLTADGDHTQLRLEHEMSADPTHEAHWAQYGPGATGVGWELAMLGLGHHLATGEANDPRAVEAWSASPSGRTFLTDCADGWALAHEASGEDSEVARAMAERTAKFYTGG
ncbi:MAG: SRPBCC family protein [Myxococcota bacterium]